MDTSSHLPILRVCPSTPSHPCRIVDTRNAVGALGGPSLAGQTTRTFPILRSTCGVPSTAQAYSLNFAAVPPGPLGYVTAFPTGQPLPLAASLTAITGTITASAVIIPAGVNGSVDVYASDPTDLVVDADGYFAPPTTSGLSLYSLTPCRVLDTRANGAPPFTGHLDFSTITAGCGVPDNAAATVLNVTAVPPGPFGYLTLWPQGQSQPLAATLNPSSSRDGVKIG